MYACVCVEEEGVVVVLARSKEKKEENVGDG